MSSIQEILETFDSGRYTTVDELQQTLTNIHDEIVFENDSINYMET
jgi:hypothetical protein